jgi:bifunctional non-homologous end joining protein LigD
MPGTKKARIKPVGTEKPMPLEVRPMMAQSSTEPFDDPEWIFEIKWDGYRAVATIDAGRVNLWSRNGLSLDSKYSRIAQELKRLKLKRAILDGEIVVLDDEGAPRFGFLQRFQKRAKRRTHVLRFRSALPEWRGPDEGSPGTQARDLERALAEGGSNPIQRCL